MCLWTLGYLQNPCDMTFLLIKKTFLNICYVQTLSPQTIVSICSNQIMLVSILHRAMSTLDGYLCTTC